MAYFLASALPRGEGGTVATMSVAAAGRYLAHAVLLSKSRSFVLPLVEPAGGVAAEDSGRLLVSLVDFVNHAADPRRVSTACRLERPARLRVLGVEGAAV